MKQNVSSIFHEEDSDKQGGIFLQQRSGSREGDLRPEAVGTSGLRQMPPAAFLRMEIECSVYGNL